MLSWFRGKVICVLTTEPAVWLFGMENHLNLERKLKEKNNFFFLYWDDQITMKSPRGERSQEAQISSVNWKLWLKWTKWKPVIYDPIFNSDREIRNKDIIYHFPLFVYGNANAKKISDEKWTLSECDVNASRAASLWPPWLTASCVSPANYAEQI